jgi:aspartyl-tRNA(Asn)/glutamyl-tRNA(Gln) amidotransferase subunit A
MKLAEMTATQLKDSLDKGETSCVEIMQSVLEQIRQREPSVQAFITLRDESDLILDADRADQRRKRGEKIGALAGLPVAVKDNICTKGLRTTCASKMLADFIPPYDATVIRRVREADGIILGKTNLDEFAMGSSTENSAMKVTHNPHNLERVPGGTSGGSAAAVGANETILAIGSDTGGSVRQPASFCGVVGFKPTYGRVSRYGLVAYGSSLDQIGPVTKDVADAALLFSVIAGHDPLDSTSLTDSIPDCAPRPPFEKFRIGIPQEYFGPGLDPEVRACVENALRLLEEQGHSIVPVSLPHTEYAVPAYYIIACAEASANLARFDGVRYGFRSQSCDDVLDMYASTRAQGFGSEVKRRIILGTYVLSSGYYDAYYLRAQKVRTLIRNDFKAAFEKCDVIAHPVAPTPAFKIGEKTDDPLAMYLGDIYSVTANLAGLPAISLPCGETQAGLPVGIQLASAAMNEKTLLQASKLSEAVLTEGKQRITIPRPTSTYAL